MKRSGGFASLLRLDAVLVAIEAIAIAAFIVVFAHGRRSCRSFRLLSCYRDILQCCFGWVSCWAGIVVPLSVDVECLRSPNPSLFVVGGCEHAARRHLPAVLPSRGRRALLSRRHESAIVLDVASLSLRYVIL